MHQVVALTSGRQEDIAGYPIDGYIVCERALVDPDQRVDEASTDGSGLGVDCDVTLGASLRDQAGWLY